jgi:hypothetical protein
VDNNASVSITKGSTTTTVSAQRIEISVFRELTGRIPSLPPTNQPPANNKNASLNMAAIQNFRRTIPITSTTATTTAAATGNNSIPNNNVNSSRSTIGSAKVQPVGIPLSVGTSHNPNLPINTSAKSNQSLKSDSLASMLVLPKHIDRTMTIKLLVLLFVETLFLWMFIDKGIQTCDGSRTEANQDSYRFATSMVSVCELQDYFIEFHGCFLLLLPYLTFIALPDLPIVTIWLCLSSTFLVIAATILSLNAHRSWLPIIVSCIFSMAMVIDNQMQKVLLFLTTRKLGSLIEENERNTEQNNAQEMRHMIANVAHDLKTVSSYFVRTPIPIILLINVSSSAFCFSLLLT